MSLLPTQPTPPVADLRELSVFIYGPPKTGKSTFASQADGAVFLATEAGLGHLTTYQIPTPDWATFLRALGELARGGHDFRTVVIDTLDNAAEMCRDHVCRSLGISDPADLEYGKGFGAVNAEWKRVLTKLTHLPLGTIWISHGREVEVEEEGVKRMMWRPSVSGKMGTIATGIADVIGFAYSGPDGPQLRTRPHRRYTAGSRIELPDPLPLTWEALSAAYRHAVETRNG